MTELEQILDGCPTAALIAADRWQRNTGPLGQRLLFPLTAQPFRPDALGQQPSDLLRIVYLK